MAVTQQEQPAQRIEAAIKSNENFRDLAEVYIGRVTDLKGVIMNAANLDAEAKDKFLKRIDSYLTLVSVDDLVPLQNKFAGYLSKIEVEVKTHKALETVQNALPSLSGAESFVLEKLSFEAIVSPDLKLELTNLWDKVKPQNILYFQKVAQFGDLIRAKNLKIEGTELAWIKNGLTAQELHLRELFDDIVASKPGEVLLNLRNYAAVLQDYYACIDEGVKKLTSISSQADLKLLTPEDAIESADNNLKLTRKTYELRISQLFELLEGTRLSTESLEYADLKRTVAAWGEQLDISVKGLSRIANVAQRAIAMNLLASKITEYIGQLEGAMKGFSVKNEVDGTKRVICEGSKNIEKARKFFTHLPGFIVPQIGILMGYTDIALKKGMSTEDKVKETADFGLSLIPFAGGIYDVVAAVRGKTLSGRDMSNLEIGLRAGVGVGSFFLDCFTFGTGGFVLKGGANAVMKGGIEITAKTAAKEIAELTAKGLAKELAEKGSVEIAGRILTKEMFEEATLVAFKKAVESGSRTEINKQMAKVIEEYFLKDIEKEAAAILAKQGSQLGAKEAGQIIKQGAEEAAKIATKSSRLPSFVRLPGKMNVERMGEVAAKTLGEDILKAATKKELIEGSMAAGRKVFNTEWYISKEFLKDSGKLSMGKIGTEMGKEFLLLHNPLAIIGHLNPMKLVRMILRRPQVLTKEELKQVENEIKVQMITDMKGIKPSEIDILLSQLKEGGNFMDFLKKNQSKYDWVLDLENQKLLRDFAQKYSAANEKSAIQEIIPHPPQFFSPA